MPLATSFLPAPAPQDFTEAQRKYLDTEFGKLKRVLSGNLQIRWDDLAFDAARSRKGSADKPDFDYTNVGMLFPEADATEILYGTSQFPHGWVGSVGQVTKLMPHVHYFQDEATFPVFVMDYRVIYNGQAVPSFTQIETDGAGAFAYSSGTILQITEFPEISVPSTASGTSALLDVKIWRKNIAGDPSGDVLVKTIDFHYEVYAIGSRLEYSDGNQYT